MDRRIPASLRPLVDAYLQTLEPLRARISGIYLYGSVALGAFEELASDIDIVALTQGEWSPSELAQLEALHAQLQRAYPLGKRLEVFYIPFGYLGMMRPEHSKGALAPYPAAHDGGKFSPATYEGLNAVTWWILKHQGISLLGPESAALPLHVTWQDVLSDMRYNLNVYVARKMKHPYVFWHDVAVEFALTNMCRILTTIEEREIISKSASLTRWRTRLPERWQPLLDEAWRIRHHLKQPPRYRHRLKRLRETLAFLHYGRERGNKALDAWDGSSGPS